MAELPVTIRFGMPSDAAAVAEFAARTFVETFGHDNRPEDMAAHLAHAYGPRQQAEQLADPDIVTLIAELNGEMGGYAQVRRGSPPVCVTSQSPVELWRFYIDRPWQGRGLAQRLMRAVHAGAQQLGGRTLWLSVWERNPRAIAFYEKCGFRAVGTHPFWVGTDRQTDCIMVADVPPRGPDAAGSGIG